MSSSPGPAPVRVAHVSDTHLGFEVYQARTSAGLNQRGADMVRAFHQAVSDIITWDPPLVIHSGDLFESPTVPTRYQLAAAAELRRLAGIRPDGSRRRVVLIAGNHDTSRNLRDGCQLDLFVDIAGVEVVTSGYREITFDDSEELAGVVVHAVPHDTLRDAELLAEVRPVDGRTNILVAHGVAEGPEIFRRMIGREFPIPVDVLACGWHYAALGHWHTQGPVDVAGDSRYAWYAGSTECVDFSDLRGRGSSTERAWLAVTTGEPRRPEVQRRTYPTRRILALDPLDGAGSSPSDIEDALLAQLLSSQPSDAVVRQRVTGLSRDLWALVDLTRLRAAAEVCLHHRVEPIYVTVNETGDTETGDTETGDDGPDLGDLESLLLSLADDLVPAEQRAATITNARRYLGSALGEPAGPDDDTAAAAVGTDADGAAEPDTPEDTDPVELVDDAADAEPVTPGAATSADLDNDADADSPGPGEDGESSVDLGDSDVGPAAPGAVPDPIDNPAEVFASFLDGDLGLRAGR